MLVNLIVKDHGDDLMTTTSLGMKNHTKPWTKSLETSHIFGANHSRSYGQISLI